MEIQQETEEEKQKKGKMQNMNHKGTQNWKRDTKNDHNTIYIYDDELNELENTTCWI